MSFVVGSNTMKVDLFNKSVTANTNILSSPISFSVQPVGIGYIYICPVGAGSLSIKQTLYGNTVTITFPAETANQPAFHSFEASWNETLNFQYSQTTTLSKFVVWEVVPQQAGS
jgi:hypothetical protein